VLLDVVVALVVVVEVVVLARVVDVVEVVVLARVVDEELVVEDVVLPVLVVGKEVVVDG
jgi:hypothetical protein